LGGAEAVRARPKAHGGKGGQLFPRPRARIRQRSACDDRAHQSFGGARMNAKKLTFPKILTLLLVGFLVVGAIYGVVRYLVLLPEGVGNDVATLRRVLWEVIPALVVLLVMY